MITCLIATTITPIVAKPRFFRVQGARGIISNRPYLEQELPARRRCHTTLVVKQGAHGFPVYFRAHSGYLHVDFKARTQKRATRKMEEVLQLQAVGQLTTWGYGVIRWILHTSYDDQEATSPLLPRFHILKGLPPNLTSQERQLVMAALLHDLVDNPYHASKLGHSITIPDPYVRWLCVHHHASNKYPDNEDLYRLQEADSRMSRYARLLTIPIPRRKLAPVDTRQLADQLEQAAQRSIFQLYSIIYHSEELYQIIAAKTHPMETLRQHLLRVANWVLFALRTSTPPSFSASVELIGKPGGTPGPVEVEDPRNPDTPSASWGVLTDMTHTRRCGHNLHPLGEGWSSCALRSYESRAVVGVRIFSATILPPIHQNGRPGRILPLTFFLYSKYSCPNSLSRHCSSARIWNNNAIHHIGTKSRPIID